MHPPTSDSAPSAVAVPHLPVPERCANCDHPRMGAYCQGCGQHHLAEPLEIRTLVRDFMERQLSLEGGLARTMVDLTVRPGPMIRDYLSGKRQRYMNPVAYMLLSATLYVLLLPLWIDRFREETLGAAEGAGTDAAEVVELSVTLMSHPIVVTLLSLVVFIPCLRALFPGRLTAAEATVFSLYTFAHASVLATLANPLLLLVSDRPTAVMSGSSMLFWIAVLAYAAGGYFGWRAGTFLRTAAAVALGMLGTMGMFMVLGIAYALGKLAAQG